MVFLSKDNNFITTAFIRSLARSFARRTFKCSLHDLQRLFANFFLILSSAEWFFLFASGNSLSCNRWIHVCVCKYGGVMARYAYVCLCIPQVGSFFSLSFYQIRKLAYTATNWCFPCSITHLWILSVQMMMQSLINGSFRMLWPVHISNGIYAFCYYRHQTDLITSLLSFLLFGCLAYVNISRYYDFSIISISDFLLKL